MRGVLALVVVGRRRAAGGAVRRVARVAGRQRAGEHRVVLDEAGPRVGEPLREQVLGGHVLEAGSPTQRPRSAKAIRLASM